MTVTLQRRCVKGSLIFGDALIYPETHYFIARQELIDLRKFTIPTIP
jgi:hypothetical protein